MQSNEELFAELVAASRILVTVSKNAATVLSEEFEDMITGPAAAVEEILNKCPEGGIGWDGVFREDDVEESNDGTYYPAPNMQGFSLTHKPSGKAVEFVIHKSASDKIRADIKASSMNALRSIVTKYVDRQREIGVM